jgi:hypothetical protein
VSAHLDDVLEGLLGLVLKVLAGLLEHVHGEEAGGNVSLSQELAVLGGVATDLAKGPGSGGLEVILGLVDKGILERGNTLADNDGHSERVVEGRDVAEGHDTGETSVALGLADVVNGGGSTAGVDDELSELSGLLGDFTNAGGSVLADLNINVLKAVKNAGEDLSLNNDLSKVDGVLGDLGKALANVTLELGIGVRDEGSKVWDGTLVNNGLGELLSVLSDLRESGGRDSLEGKLGLLNAENEESNGSSVDDGLGKLVVVLGNAGEGKGGGFLHGGVKLFEAGDESVESTGVNDGLGEVGRVLGDGAEHVSGGLLVEALKFELVTVTAKLCALNLRFARTGSTRAGEGSRWRQQPQQARQSSWRGGQERERHSAGWRARYRARGGARGP